MDIKAIEKQNIVDKVFEQMKQKILKKEWRPGDKIPSEPKLCDLFQVSRVSVRSAIQRLRDSGLIETCQGKGSFVSESLQSRVVDTSLPMMNITEKEYLDMKEFRETIEFKCIELAAQRATKQDLQEIEAALNKMYATINDYKKYSLADYEFHLAVAKASKNELFYQLMKQNKQVYYRHLEELNRVFGKLDGSFKGHQKQFLAIQNRDSETAKAEIKMSIDENRKKVRK